MLNSKDNIGKAFCEVMDGFDEDLPNKVWDNVNSELKKEKERKKTFFYIGIAASVALIIAFSAGYYMALNNTKQPQFSNSNNNKVQDSNTLIDTADSKVNKTDINKNEANSLEKKENENLKRTYITPVKIQINTSLSYEAKDKEQKHESNFVIIDSVIQPQKEPVAINDNKIIVNDTSTITPKIDIYKDFKKDIDKQADIINKNQKIINNNLPEEKIKEPENTPGKWSLAEQFSPVGNWGNSAQKEALADQGTGYNSINQSENEKISNKKLLLVYATGMSFKFQLNKKWGVKSGVFYVSREFNSVLQYRQIEVPVMADYSLINKKIIWELGGGLGANFWLNPGENSTNYSAIAGTALGYNITKRVSVNIEPTLKYNFSYPDNYIFHYYPFSVAVYTGLSYKF